MRPCSTHARGDSGPRGDTHILIEIDPDAGNGVRDYVAIRGHIASSFEGTVDVVDREASPQLRGRGARRVWHTPTVGLPRRHLVIESELASVDDV
jgi:hypothetical protein